jgi:anaphase-promoting complex subunit 2
MDEYDREYRKAKASRKLKFLPAMGSVTLDLEFETRTLRINARPEAALIIELFRTRGNLHYQIDTTTDT